MDKNKTFYESNSLVLASTLVCLGFPLDSVTKNSDGKTTFIFLRTDSNLDKVLESFWQRSLKVEPNSFFEAQRFLKSRIYGG
ncbi:hypothetical protein A3D79_02250 [Candidatus Daviesbacteria bacterium RIFCSPHIGHO2_02_FULL_39_8]|nr:MAG: hypothetical protein A3D79_02250 [Candidatus Daviesbacteria bacterium RIFCSPHIGHO2_02_FULL_39_8]